MILCYFYHILVKGCTYGDGIMAHNKITIA